MAAPLRRSVLVRVRAYRMMLSICRLAMKALSSVLTTCLSASGRCSTSWNWRSSSRSVTRAAAASSLAETLCRVLAGSTLQAARTRAVQSAGTVRTMDQHFSELFARYGKLNSRLVLPERM